MNDVPRKAEDEVVLPVAEGDFLREKSTALPLTSRPVIEISGGRDGLGREIIFLKVARNPGVGPDPDAARGSIMPADRLTSRPAKPSAFENIRRVFPSQRMTPLSVPNQRRPGLSSRIR